MVAKINVVGVFIARYYSLFPQKRISSLPKNNTVHCTTIRKHYIHARYTTATYLKMNIYTVNDYTVIISYIECCGIITT